MELDNLDDSSFVLDVGGTASSAIQQGMSGSGWSGFAPAMELPPFFGCAPAIMHPVMPVLETALLSPAGLFDFPVLMPAASAQPAAESKKRKSNVPVACSTCYSQKAKCDGQRPCDRCIKRGRPQDCRDRTQYEIDRLHAKRRKLSRMPTAPKPAAGAGAGTGSAAEVAPVQLQLPPAVSAIDTVASHLDEALLHTQTPVTVRALLSDCLLLCAEPLLCACQDILPVLSHWHRSSTPEAFAQRLPSFAPFMQARALRRFGSGRSSQCAVQSSLVRRIRRGPPRIQRPSSLAARTRQAGRN